MKIINIVLLSIGCILLLFSSLYFLTSDAFIEGFDFHDTGQIGDTIGGISSPIINIIGSLLIFISFLSQNNANKLQSQQNSFNFLHSLYNDIKIDYDNITFRSSKVYDGEEFKGRRAVSVFIKTLPNKLNTEQFRNNSFFFEYMFVIGSISILLNRIEKADLPESDKKDLLQVLHFFFETRLKEQNDEILNLLKDDNQNEKFHESIKNIADKMEESYQKNFQLEN